MTDLRGGGAGHVVWGWQARRSHGHKCHRVEAWDRHEKADEFGDSESTGSVYHTDYRRVDQRTGETILVECVLIQLLKTWCVSVMMMMMEVVEAAVQWLQTFLSLLHSQSSRHPLHSTADFIRGSVWLLQYGIQKLNRGSSCGCISTFSINLTFDKTLVMQFCYFSAKIATFWAINVWVFKTQLEYFCAQLLHSSTLGHSYCHLTVHQVFKLSFEYLHIYSPKSGDFCWKKLAKLHH